MLKWDNYFGIKIQELNSSVIKKKKNDVSNNSKKSIAINIVTTLSENSEKHKQDKN